MTREQRILLRHLIDQAKRRQLAAQKQPRDAYYQTYYSDNSARIRAARREHYWRNRDRILARRAEQRAA